MKIQVDDKGWAVVADPADPSAKPTSGVYLKSDEADKREEPRVAQPSRDLGEAATEPSIPSAEAISQGAAPLPPPSALPADLLALSSGDRVTGDPKVA